MVEAYAKALEYLRATEPADRQRKKHRLPLESYTLSDREFFFTICARHAVSPFADPVLSQQVIESLLWCREQYRWTLYCYCLMPDHLHVIIQLPNGEVQHINAGARGVVPFGILEQIGYFKSYTTNQVWWKQGVKWPLWQKSSHDRVIRYNQSIEAAVRYVLDNPVRKGLVENPEDYPYSAIVDPL